MTCSMRDKISLSVTTHFRRRSEGTGTSSLDNADGGYYQGYVTDGMSRPLT